MSNFRPFIQQSACYQDVVSEGDYFNCYDDHTSMRGIAECKQRCLSSSY